MSYNPENEIARLESRIANLMDLRFKYVTERLDSIAENLELLEGKFDKYVEGIQVQKADARQWLVRQAIVTIISFLLGGGAIALVDYLVKVLR